jgi:signal transduction histidine kinase
VTDRIARAVFGLLFETSPDAALIVDRPTGRVVSANVRAADMFARATDELGGMVFEDLILEPERDLTAPGRYEDVALRRGDNYPIYVTMQVAYVETREYGDLVAYMARDTSERRLLESEVMAKHTALFVAHAELERAHSQLGEAKAELEHRNQEIAMLAWRAAMGELVAGIAHHLNNPVGALASTVRRLGMMVEKVPPDERLIKRINQIARRIESNVAAIVHATHVHAIDSDSGKLELPPELATVLSTFAEKLDDIPTKEPQ